MVRDQENTLLFVLGVVGVPLTCRVLYEWAPGDRFATTMAVTMMAWTLYYTTWVIQRIRYRPLAPYQQHQNSDEVAATLWPTASGDRPLTRTTASISEGPYPLHQLHG